MSCVHRQNITIIRGDTFDQIVGFAEGWDNIAASPGDYQVRILFRDRQDDDLEHHLAVTASIAAASDPNFPAMLYSADVSLTPAQTQTLPSYDHFYFVEVRKPDGTYIERLYEGKVTVKD